MTRIIAGTARGRRLKVPANGTRPTSDRTREALFSSLAAADALAGASVLDLYAGSGAFGLEAVSRGAAAAVLVEKDPEAAAVCRANAAVVGGTAVTVVCADVGRLVGLAPTVAGAPFDLVLLDPPYEIGDEAVAEVLVDLAAHSWLAEGADIVVERAARGPGFAWPPGFAEDRRRVYGGTVLWYGHRIGSVA